MYRQALFEMIWDLAFAHKTRETSTLNCFLLLAGTVHPAWSRYSFSESMVALMAETFIKLEVFLRDYIPITALFKTRSFETTKGYYILHGMYPGVVFNIYCICKYSVEKNSSVMTYMTYRPLSKS